MFIKQRAKLNFAPR